MVKVKKILPFFLVISIIISIAVVYWNYQFKKFDSENMLVTEQHILMPNYSLDELVANSQYILIGKCLGKEISKYAMTSNSMTGEGYETITTDFNIDVIRVIKGNLDDNSIVIRSDIGQVGNKISKCKEQVEFSDEEKVLLFINKDTFESDNCYRASFFIGSKYDFITEDEYYNSYFGNTIKLDDIISLL